MEISACALLSLAIMVATPCHAGFIPLPFSDIKGEGLGKFAVFNSDAKNDTLLWRSEMDQKNNQFRLWGLESGAYYAVTFGAKDDDPGRLAAFCGYFGGENGALYDIALGKLGFLNREPSTERDYAGQILHLSNGDFKVKKGKVAIKSEQGEFTDATKLESFLFVFDMADAEGPSMRHDLAEGGPADGHPATYRAKAINLTQALTIQAMYSAFESGDHKWNPKAVVTTLTDFAGWDMECLTPAQATLRASACGIPGEQEIIEYITYTQPANVREPAPWLLLLIGAPLLGFQHHFRHKNQGLR